MIRRTVLVVLLLLINAQIGVGQEIKDHKLTVYGKVRVFAKADRAHIKFEIKGVGSSLKSAFENARVKLDSISTRLFAAGLPQSSLSTSFFRNEENYGDKAFLSSKKDYRAAMVVTITTDKLELLEKIAIIISEGSIEKIEEVSFELVNYTQLRKDAIERATLAAKEKAELVAKTLGIKCGEVLEFEEMRAEPVVRDESQRWLLRAQRDVINPFNAVAGFEQDASYGSLYPENVQFDAEVKIVFAIAGAKVENAEPTNKQ